MKLCLEFTEGEAFPIKLYQRGKDCFRVVYGMQDDDRLTYGEACSKLGQALMHSAACEGKLDNREKGEA